MYTLYFREPWISFIVSILFILLPFFVFFQSEGKLSKISKPMVSNTNKISVS